MYSNHAESSQNNALTNLSLVNDITTFASSLKVISENRNSKLVNFSTSCLTNDTVSSLKWFLPSFKRLEDLNHKYNYQREVIFCKFFEVVDHLNILTN